MKKILLSSVLLALSVAAFAQTKPDNGDNSFTFGINGINTIGVNTPSQTGTLLFKHYLQNGLAARVGLNLGTSSSTTGGYTGNDSIKGSSTSWAVTLGIQKAFKGTDKLETYIGADLILGGGSSTTTTNDVNNKAVYEVKNGATFKFGIMPCMGMNYYIASWLAIGTEFGWGFTSNSTAEGTITTTIAGVSSVTKSPKYSSAGLGTWAHGMITVTAAFH